MLEDKHNIPILLYVVDATTTTTNNFYRILLLYFSNNKLKQRAAVLFYTVQCIFSLEIILHNKITLFNISYL